MVGRQLNCQRRRWRGVRPGGRTSVEVPVDIHVLVEDAHHFDQISTCADTVIKGVRSCGMPPVAGTNLVARPPYERVVRHKFNGVLNNADVRFGLIVIPLFAGVVPDLLQIGLGSRRQDISSHPL